jgi:predicted nucleic acid-binding protein
LIYLVEHVPQFGELVASRLSSTDVIVVSELSRLECRVKPLREGDTALLDEFDRFFDESVSEVIVLSREVMDRATEIRALYGFKTPGAIHLAAAKSSNCELFLTNDHRLDRFTGLRIETLTA